MPRIKNKKCITEDLCDWYTIFRRTETPSAQQRPYSLIPMESSCYRRMCEGWPSTCELSIDER